METYIIPEKLYDTIVTKRLTHKQGEKSHYTLFRAGETGYIIYCKDLMECETPIIYWHDDFDEVIEHYQQLTIDDDRALM